MKKESLNIEDYADDLMALCEANFRKCRKCKDHNKMCFLKRSVWSMAKMKYSRKFKNNGGQL